MKIKDYEIEPYANLRGAYLRGAYLRGANLRDAYLRGADLRDADLEGADLRDADLRGANLRDANLRDADLEGANLRGAYLRGANLRGANLRDANLEDANLRDADLRGADLRGADLEFYLFPSIRLLSSMPLDKVSDKLTLELMRRDAYGHPDPERFNQWAKGGDCPYQNEERMWHFKENKKLWRRGKPQMRDYDLIVTICKEKGWKIKNHI